MKNTEMPPNYKVPDSCNNCAFITGVKFRTLTQYTCSKHEYTVGNFPDHHICDDWESMKAPVVIKDMYPEHRT